MISYDLYYQLSVPATGVELHQDWLLPGAQIELALVKGNDQGRTEERCADVGVAMPSLQRR